MNQRDLTLAEVKTICDFVASHKEGERWLLFSYDPDKETPIGFAAPAGISKKDMIRIAIYMLEAAKKDLR